MVLLASLPRLGHNIFPSTGMVLIPHLDLSESIPLFSKCSLGSRLLKDFLPIDRSGHEQAFRKRNTGNPGT
eukprot:7310257-Alexandrium_andersonii.AAC.1